jgi:ribosomal protein L1
MVEIQLDVSDVKERKTDKRGRVRLGPEYAGKDVTIAVVDVQDDETEDAAEQAAD